MIRAVVGLGRRCGLCAAAEVVLSDGSVFVFDLAVLQMLVDEYLV